MTEKVQVKYDIKIKILDKNLIWRKCKIYLKNTKSEEKIQIIRKI